MQQPQPQQQPQMQQRIHQIPQSAAPVMFATPVDMNGYAAIYQYPTAFQQPPPQQFMGAEAGYQANPQFSIPPPMYNPVAPPPPQAPAANAYSRPPPPQQQAYYAMPHPTMMAPADPPRNPFVVSNKHCLSVFDTPAESSAAYTASWVSSTSSIPPEQKASPDQDSNPPTPSEYSHNWHENNVHRASPLVDEFAAGASATSGFSPPIGDNTLEAQLASLNISHADFTAGSANGKGPMPSGFYGARTINPQIHTQTMTVHSLGPQIAQAPQYMAQAPAMYYQSAPPQATNSYYVSNQPPAGQHVIDVSGNTWADMVKKGGNCSLGETRVRTMSACKQDQHSGHASQNASNQRRYNGKQYSSGTNGYQQNGRAQYTTSQPPQQRRKQRNDRNNGNGHQQSGDFGTFNASNIPKSQQNYFSPSTNQQYIPAHSPVNVMNGGSANANNVNASYSAPAAGPGQQFNYPPPYFMSQGIPSQSTSATAAASSGNNNLSQNGFRSTWLDEHLPALDMVIHDNALSAQAIVQEKILKGKSNLNQFVVPPPNMMAPPPAPNPSGVHRFIPGAFGMTAFIPICPPNYQQHSSSPPQGQFVGQQNRQRRAFNGGYNGKAARNPKQQSQFEESDKEREDDLAATADSEDTIKADDEEVTNDDSGKGEHGGERK